VLPFPGRKRIKNKRKEEKENGMLGMDGEKKAGSQFCVDISKRRRRALLGFARVSFHSPLPASLHPPLASLHTQGNSSPLCTLATAQNDDRRRLNT
jgi:hypothetical protein